jgi:hypothetical protein
MRIRTVWLASALTAGLLFVAASVAQPPGRRGGPPRAPGGGLERIVDDLKLSGEKRETTLAAVQGYQDNLRRLGELAGAGLLLKMKSALTPEEFRKVKEAVERPPPFGPGRGFGRGAGVEDVIERLMSFDKNKDGKITKDELPERMQYLIAKGDTNKDGALDRDEIRKLATELARDGGLGRGRRGRGGPGGPPLGAVERALRDLKLSGKKQEAASAAVKAYQEELRKLRTLARADLLLKVDALLSAEQIEKLEAAVDRLPERGPPRGRRGPGRPGRP